MYITTNWNIQEHEQRDDYMEVREGLDLAQTPFKETMIAFSNPKSRPWLSFVPL